MFQSRLQRLGWALVAASCSAVLFASLATGMASAADCTADNVFRMGITNTCDTATFLTGSAVTQLSVTSSAPGTTSIFADASATTGASDGIVGVTSSGDAGAFGVFGALKNSSPGSPSAGVEGRSSSTTANGPGVYGLHSPTTGSAAGVLGETNSADANATGVTGTVVSTSPGAGATAVRGINSGTNGNGYGVWGSHAGSGDGVLGQSSSGIGVLGFSSLVGVYGVGHYGLIGAASSGGLAGYFVGNVNVTGTLTKGAGAFRIDHPLDPARKYLQHSFVESPDMMDVYNGNVVTDGKGFATVKLPGYFQALNRSFRYQLTLVGRSFAQAIVWKEIQANRFTIRTDRPNVKVSWQVTGVRHDVYANAHRIPVVLDKQAVDQGKYLHPELYGKPRSLSIARLPERALREARR